MVRLFILLIVLSFLAPSVAFRPVAAPPESGGANVPGKILQLVDDYRVIADTMEPSPPAADSEYQAQVIKKGTSMGELNGVLEQLPGNFPPKPAALERNRHMVWDHVIVTKSPPSTACCAEYPFCGCPKL